MPVHNTIAAQDAMDLFFTNYRTPADFFQLEDFERVTAGIVGNLYSQGYRKDYDEFRQEKKDEVVSFDPAILNDQLLTVERKDGELFSKLERPCMSFLYDEQGIGVQDVRSIKPLNGVKFERTTTGAQWQLEYVPNCNIVFWYLEREKIKYINKSSCNIQQVKILYVPSILDPDFLVPDGVYSFVVTTAAATIKEIVKGTIPKMSNDQNPNRLIQTEINPLALK
jgi:hypothetical protein